MRHVLVGLLVLSALVWAWLEVPKRAHAYTVRTWWTNLDRVGLGDSRAEVESVFGLEAPRSPGLYAGVYELVYNNPYVGERMGPPDVVFCFDANDRVVRIVPGRRPR